MQKTNLYDKHVALHAKIVPFAGFLMPIEYHGLKSEHLAVRENVGIFDVSHMGQIRVSGPDTLAFINYVFTNELRDLPLGATRYGFLCYPSGGVVDDLIIYKFSALNYLLVVNAANKDKDYAWLLEHRANFNVEIIDESAQYDLLALQGPNALVTLKRVMKLDLSDVRSGHFNSYPYEGAEIFISRTGYTGEDGFEIYASPAIISKLWDEFLRDGVTPCGLGARDTLRFEAGMPLYGHELSPTINPLEAGLGFAIKLEKDFIGRDALVTAKEKGLVQKIVALELLERGIPREGYQVFKNGREVGVITTGYLTPSTGKALAFALLKTAETTLGNEVEVIIRDRPYKAVVRDKKFYEKRNKQ